MNFESKRLKFENPDDLIDYVTRGVIPPSRLQYNEFMNKVHRASTTLVTDDGSAISITSDSLKYFDDMTNDELLERIIGRAYENQVHNRNITVGAVVGFFVLGLLGGTKIGEHKANKEKD